MAISLSSPRIDHFNPRRLSDQQIAALATGRDDLLADLLRNITRNADRDSGGSIQHMAFVAPRGYGKSFLLRQLRMEVERLAKGGCPVAYAHLPEELPNVSSIAALVEEIRRLMLGQLTGGIGYYRDEAPDALDRATKALDAALDERFGPGKGLAVAAIENFDELLDRLARKAQRAVRRRGVGQPQAPRGLSAGDWAVELALRGLIERRTSRLMLVITATRAIRNDHPSHPLFQWVNEIKLEPWTDAEVLEYALRRRKLSKGETAQLSEKEQIQVKALAEFASGAQRMITVLVDHLLEQDLDHATLNLSALIDELTPFYQDRIKALGDEAGLVFDALLRGGEPASQTEIAARFAERTLNQSILAEAFKKLQSERLVVGVKERGGNKKAILYRVADRIMAYWYKQRQVISHDPAANGISHFEEAVELLVRWLSRDDLALEAERFARHGRREEAALFSYLSRHGLPPRDGSGSRRHGPRRHLTFGFALRLELLARLLEPEDRPEAARTIAQVKSGDFSTLIEALKRQVQCGMGPRRVFNLCALGVAHALGGADHERDDQRAEAALTQARAVAEVEANCDVKMMVDLLSAMMQWHVLGDKSKSLAQDKAIYGLLDEAVTPEAKLIAHHSKGFASYHDGDYREALEQAEVALELSQELVLSGWESRCHEQLAWAFHSMGNSERALDEARQVVAWARRSADAEREACGMIMISAWESILGRREESLDAALQAVAPAMTAEDFSTAAYVFLLQCQNLAALGRHDEALTAARQAAEHAASACDASREQEAFVAEIGALNALRHYEQALGAAVRMFAWAARNRDDAARAEALFEQGGALDYLGRRDEAVAALRQALAIGHADNAFCYRVLSLLGYVLRRLRRDEEAVTTLAEAIKLGGTLDEPAAQRTDLDNLLISADRLPATITYGPLGEIILSAFADLAALDLAQALVRLRLALRVSIALSRYDALETVLRLAERNGALDGPQLQTLARELGRAIDSQGRAKAYAACMDVLASLTPGEDSDPSGRNARDSLLDLLASNLRDAGLLRDLADFLQEQGADAQRARIDALRGRALSLESGGDPAALERIDPDLAQLFQVVKDVKHLPTRRPSAEDADLAVRPCVVALVGQPSFAGLPVDVAGPELVSRFDEHATDLNIANLEAFDSSKLRAAALPFLPDAVLLLLPHRDGEFAVPFVLHADGLTLARRQNDWIYELMEDRPPFDLADTAEASARLMAYARFFFTVICGALGAFVPIDRVEEIRWTGDATAEKKEEIGAMVQPMVRLSNDGGEAVLRSTVIFKNALFRTSIRIKPDGMMELADEELLAEDLPIHFGAAADLVVGQRVA